MSKLEDAAIAACNDEPVHIPGQIQPHGAVLVCNRATFQITHASVNVAGFFARDCDDLLGSNLKTFLTDDLLHRLRNVIQMPSIADAQEPVGSFCIANQVLDICAYQSGDSVVLEFEPCTTTPWAQTQTAREITRLFHQISWQSNSQDLLDGVAFWLSKLTGFDRVMVYKFDDDGCGEVIAEEVASGMEPFLGLRFPSWDIPPQARAIMTRMPLRMISDVGQEPVPLRALEQSAPPVNLSAGYLRGVSPVHMEYLANMGIAGSMTLSIIVEGTLWGLIAFHHETPRVVSSHIRAICLPFIEFMNVKLAYLDQCAAAKRREEIKRIQANVRDRHAEGVDIGAIISEAPMPLIQQFSADGMVIKVCEEVHSFGTVLPADVIEPLVASALRSGKIAAYENLGVEAEVRASQLNEIGGVLVVPLLGDDFAVVFRKEVITQVKWAGAPTKKITEDAGHVRLSPRGSFDLYTQVVKGRCAPWREIDIELAEGLATIVLQSSHQRARMERDYFEDRVRQQNLMIGELNHRVRNILTLIRSVSREARDSNKSLDGFVLSLENRIDALAFAHDLSTNDASPVVGIFELLRSEAKPYLPENSARLVLQGEDVSIRTDLCSVVVLALHELTTNARKYGALSNNFGVVSVSLSRKYGGLEISWRETGGPVVVEPAEAGFGRDLIEKAIPYELEGRVDLRFAPDGVAADIWLPDEVLSTTPKAQGHALTSQVFSDTVVDLTFPTPKVDAAGSNATLLLEDNYVISADMTKALKAAGYLDVRAVGNVKDAFELIDKGFIGQAVLDMHLGDENSFPVAFRLQSLGIPFVFATGYGSNLTRPKELESFGVLTKPVDGSELRLALEQLSQRAAG